MISYGYLVMEAHFSIPNNNRAEWCIYEEENIYHALIKMPSYDELNRIILAVNKEENIKDNINMIDNLNEINKLVWTLYLICLPA